MHSAMGSLWKFRLFPLILTTFGCCLSFAQTPRRDPGAPKNSEPRAVHSLQAKNLSGPPFQLIGLRVNQRGEFQGAPEFDVRFRIQNVSSSLQKEIPLAVEVLSAKGQVKAFHGFVLHANLKAGQETYFATWINTLKKLEVEPDDQFVISPWVESASSEGIQPLSLVPLVEDCDTFCDNCVTRATDTCTNGVQAFSCGCGPPTCSFTCFPPPK